MRRHVGQRIEPVLGPQLDLVDRLVSGTLPLLVHMPVTVEVAVRPTVELGRVGFQRMGTELFDIDRDRSRQALRTKHVESRRQAVGVREQRQPVLRSRLVGRDQRRRILNRGVRPGQVGDSCFPCHDARSPWERRVPTLPR